ncbi:MAG: hypothetical protein ACON5A_04895 [Candidatus Comchoanobacterales bacterium]
MPTYYSEFHTFDPASVSTTLLKMCLADIITRKLNEQTKQTDQKSHVDNFIKFIENNSDHQTLINSLFGDNQHPSIQQLKLNQFRTMDTWDFERDYNLYLDEERLFKDESNFKNDKSKLLDLLNNNIISSFQFAALNSFLGQTHICSLMRSFVGLYYPRGHKTHINITINTQKGSIDVTDSISAESIFTVDDASGLPNFIELQGSQINTPKWVKFDTNHQNIQTLHKSLFGQQQWVPSVISSDELKKNRIPLKTLSTQFRVTKEDIKVDYCFVNSIDLNAGIPSSVYHQLQTHDWEMLVNNESELNVSLPPAKPLINNKINTLKVIKLSLLATAMVSLSYVFAHLSLAMNTLCWGILGSIAISPEHSSRYFPRKIFINSSENSKATKQKVKSKELLHSKATIKHNSKGIDHIQTDRAHFNSFENHKNIPNEIRVK